MSLFKRFFGSTRDNDPIAWNLYEAAVNQARSPSFYATYGIPDTLDGRFELISLHVYLILRRLKRETGESGDLGQNLFDAMFSDMDRSLREMGAGDLGVAPRVKKMARAFYGRISAFDAALDGESDAPGLEDTVRRNIYGTVAEPDENHVQAMAAYIRKEDQSLAKQSMQDLKEGRVAFAALRNL